MEYIDSTFLRIDQLVCSDSFEERLPQPHVAELAQSIRTVGLIHKPWVRASTGEVIQGEDRVAAHVLLNADGLEVDLYECTDAEMLAVREAENRHRRPPTGAELLARVSKKLESVAPPAPEPKESHVGRPKLESTKALEEVAEEAGISKDAARKKIERAKKKEQRAKDEPEVEQAPPFETWGRAVDPQLLSETAEAHRALTAAAAGVSLAIGRITALQKKALIRDNLGNQLAELLRDAGGALRRARPAALCAWCKGQPDLRKGCAACLGASYLLEANMDSIPAELKDPRSVMVGGKPGVVDEGMFVAEEMAAVISETIEAEIVDSWGMANGTTIEFGEGDVEYKGTSDFLWEEDAPRPSAEPDAWDGDLFPEGAEEVDEPL